MKKAELSESKIKKLLCHEFHDLKCSEVVFNTTYNAIIIFGGLGYLPEDEIPEMLEFLGERTSFFFIRESVSEEKDTIIDISQGYGVIPRSKYLAFFKPFEIIQLEFKEFPGYKTQMYILLKTPQLPQVRKPSIKVSLVVSN